MITTVLLFFFLGRYDTCLEIHGFFFWILDDEKVKRCKEKKNRKEEKIEKKNIYTVEDPGVKTSEDGEAGQEKVRS